MKFRYLIILFCITICFCNCNKSSQAQVSVQTQAFDNADVSDTLPSVDTIVIAYDNDNNQDLPIVTCKDGIEILIRGSFRGQSPKDFNYLYNNDWLTLYADKDNKQFYLDETRPRLDYYEDECSGDSTTSVLDNRHSNVFIFVKGLMLTEQKYPIPVKAIPFTGDSASFKHPRSFIFNNIHYLVEVTSKDGNNTENFILTLSETENNKTKKQVLVRAKSLNDTFPRIIFVGDLDNDSKPDFLLDISRDYEESRFALFLSSKAHKDEIVCCLGISDYQFDC